MGDVSRDLGSREGCHQRQNGSLIVSHFVERGVFFLQEDFCLRLIDKVVESVITGGCGIVVNTRPDVTQVHEGATHHQEAISSLTPLQIFSTHQVRMKSSLNDVQLSVQLTGRHRSTDSLSPELDVAHEKRHHIDSMYSRTHAKPKSWRAPFVVHEVRHQSLFCCM